MSLETIVYTSMATRLFNALGKVGIGLAVAGGVVNSALYNGMYILLDSSVPMPLPEY